MKIITDNGIKLIEKDSNCKLVSSDKLNKTLKFWFEDSVKQKEFHYLLKTSGVKYSSDANITMVNHEELERLLIKEMFTEERVWFGAGGKIYLCKDCDQQHISNSIHYCEILVTLGKLDQNKFDDYMSKLQESMIPELEERFGGELLDYVPFYDWEKKQYEEYLKLKVSCKSCPIPCNIKGSAVEEELMPEECTCHDCSDKDCRLRGDAYNSKGDCLADK